MSSAFLMTSQVCKLFFFLITCVSRSGSFCCLSGSNTQNHVQKWRDSSGLSREPDEEWRTGSIETETSWAGYVQAELQVRTPCPTDGSSHGEHEEMNVQITSAGPQKSAWIQASRIVHPQPQLSQLPCGHPRVAVACCSLIFRFFLQPSSPLPCHVIICSWLLIPKGYEVLTEGPGMRAAGLVYTGTV